MTKRVSLARIHQAVERLGSLPRFGVEVPQYFALKRAGAQSDTPVTITTDTVSTFAHDFFAVEGLPGFSYYVPVKGRRGELWRGDTTSGWATGSLWSQFKRGSQRMRSLGSFAPDDTSVEITLHASDVYLPALAKLTRDDRLPIADFVAWRYRYTAIEDGTTVQDLTEQFATELHLSAAERSLVFAELGAEEDGDFFAADDWPAAQLVEMLPAPEPKNEPLHAAAPPPPASASDVIIEERLWRVLVNTLRAFNVVLLVGPPGTGKGRLIGQLVEAVRQEPAGFGFADHGQSWPDPVKRTPDESWTAFELVGGLVPIGSEHQLRWSPGVVLDAIAANQWLILDETNRADLDKIFGPLLTWLSGEEVEIGRLDASAAAPPVSLGWADDATCVVDPPDGVASGGDSSVSRIRYLAGRDWRFLGTYNPQDAQRVFSFGVALGRRFRTVPIPLLDPAQFEQLLETRYSSLEPDVHSRVSGLYAAHLGADRTRLGPALFLEIARYIEVALTGASDADSDELAAEGYAVTAGRYLASYRLEELTELGNRVVDDSQALSREQWDWTATQIALLR